jgi:hypothetical protein
MSKQPLHNAQTQAKILTSQVLTFLGVKYCKLWLHIFKITLTILHIRSNFVNNLSFNKYKNVNLTLYVLTFFCGSRIPSHTFKMILGVNSCLPVGWNDTWLQSARRYTTIISRKDKADVTKAYGGMELKTHAFLTCKEVSRQLHATATYCCQGRPLIVQAWIRSQTSPCRICGGESGTGTGLSLNTVSICLMSAIYTSP